MAACVPADVSQNNDGLVELLMPVCRETWTECTGAQRLSAGLADSAGHQG